MNIIYTALSNSTILILSIIIFLLSCLITFDKRLTQAKRDWLKDERDLPKWTGILYWIYLPLLIILFILNWRWALIFYIALFILAVLPVLETIGNLLWGLIVRKK